MSLEVIYFDNDPDDLKRRSIQMRRVGLAVHEYSELNEEARQILESVDVVLRDWDMPGFPKSELERLARDNQKPLGIISTSREDEFQKSRDFGKASFFFSDRNKDFDSLVKKIREATNPK